MQVDGPHRQEHSGRSEFAMIHQSRQPLVSIVIPVHNGMPFIRVAVQSALDQDYENLEVLVMENMSDDGTAEWLSEITDPRVRVVSQDDLVSVDRNFTDAVATATGEFLRILCADDFLRPGAVAAHVGAFERYPDAVLVSSVRDICDERGKTLIKARGLDGLDTVSTREEVVRACGEYGTNVIGEPFCRTSAVHAELPFSPEARFVLDLELYVRVLRHGTLVTIPGTYSAFRVSESGYSAGAPNSQAAHFTSWFSSLSADPSLDLTADEVRYAAKQARKNQNARSVFYRYVQVRNRARQLMRRS